MSDILVPSMQSGQNPLRGRGVSQNPSPAELSLHPRTENDEMLTTIDELNVEINFLDRENRQLRGLLEFNQQLQSVIDTFVAAQMGANMIQRILDCEFVGIFRRDRDENRLEMLTAVGEEAVKIREKLGDRWERFPHSMTGGLIGQALRLRKIQLSVDVDPTLELLQASGRPFRSLIAAPLVANGHLEGAILIADTAAQKFLRADLAFVENICSNLMFAWERIGFDEQQIDILESIATISSNFKRQRSQFNFLKEIACLTRKSSRARMTICALYEDPDWVIQADGIVDSRLMQQNSGLARFLLEILNSGIPIRMADLRRDPRTIELDIEDSNLRALLACPFTVNGMAGGVLMALGVDNNLFFTEKDERLIGLLAANASITVNRFLTEVELNETLTNLKIVHNLSLDIARSRNLQDAIHTVALKAGFLFEARSGGLVLVDPNTGRLGTGVHFPANNPDVAQPDDTILAAIETKEKQEIPGSETYIHVYPIMTQEVCYGALWLELPFVGPRYGSREDKIQTLIKQTAVALESAIRMHELSSTYRKLETTLNKQKTTWDAMIRGFVQALDARELETANHSARIAELAWMIGREMGYKGQDLQDLIDGALLHDIGKIGIEDSILSNTGPLNLNEKKKMREHVAIGEKIVRDIPGMAGAAEIIANYHELWNGSGYPRGKEGQLIPKLARIVTVADVYDAMTNDRPYRSAMPPEEVVDYLKEHAGILYDSTVVAALLKVLASREFGNRADDATK